jgi:hypothetical protein
MNETKGNNEIKQGIQVGLLIKAQHLHIQYCHEEKPLFLVKPFLRFPIYPCCWPVGSDRMIKKNKNEHTKNWSFTNQLCVLS